MFVKQNLSYLTLNFHSSLTWEVNKIETFMFKEGFRDNNTERLTNMLSNLHLFGKHTGYIK